MQLIDNKSINIKTASQKSKLTTTSKNGDFLAVGGLWGLK